MPADVSIRFRAESQQARKEVQILRGTLTQLNKTLVENRNALLTSTGEERKRIQAVQAANAVQKAALQQQIRETQGRKQAIADLQRETRERERAAAQQAAAAQRVGKAQEQAARRSVCCTKCADCGSDKGCACCLSRVIAFDDRVCLCCCGHGDVSQFRAGSHKGHN